jgi:hypothetical protein
MVNSSFPKGFTDGIVKLNSAMAKLVENFAAMFGPLAALKDGHATKRYSVCQLLSLLLFLGFVGGTARAAVDVQSPPATSLEHGLPFAIADFDGDLRPDFASIQARQINSDNSDYAIQLRLSTAGPQSIQLVAPSGGLALEARDVNGDRAVDLLVFTLWRKQPVAIFLNDGHGRFSRAALSAFPGAFCKSDVNLASGSNSETDTLGLAPQSGAGICPKEKDSLHHLPRAELISALSPGFPLSSFSVSRAGRAPPSSVHHS